MSEEPEKFDGKKFISGIGKPTNFAKLTVGGINLSLIILVFLGLVFVKNFFFPNNQKQTTVIKVAKGASVGSITTTQQQSAKKTVGLEVFGSTEKGGLVFKKYFNDSMYAGVGGAWVFQGEDKGSVVPEIRVGFDF